MNSLRFSWLVVREEAPSSLMELFLQLCHDLLPEASPVKFGIDDPPKEAFAWDDFVAMSEHGDFGWTASRPFGYGSMSNLCALDAPSQHLVAGTLEPARVGAISMGCASDFLEDSNNVERVRTFFLAVAEACESFLAQVEVKRDAKWSGPYLSAKLSNPALLRGRVFNGLPIGDVWLVHFGPRYFKLLNNEVHLTTIGRGGFLEIEGAWQGIERDGTTSLMGRVPDRFLLYTLRGLSRKRGRSDIRAGAPVHPADEIPTAFV